MARFWRVTTCASASAAVARPFFDFQNNVKMVGQRNGTQRLENTAFVDRFDPIVHNRDEVASGGRLSSAAIAQLDKAGGVGYELAGGRYCV